MSVIQYTIRQFVLNAGLEASGENFRFSKSCFAPLRPLRQWLANLDISRPHVAHRLCHLIPAQCPFARTLRWGNRVLLTIPPLCKINPFYEELMTLRFRALCYLADDCGEDISQYC